VLRKYYLASPTCQGTSPAHHGIDLDLRLVDVAAMVHREVQCSKPRRDAIVRWTVMRAWHLGQRGCWAARGDNSGCDDCRSDMALIRAKVRIGDY
jgi:hypothetical protein